MPTNGVEISRNYKFIALIRCRFDFNLTDNVTDLSNTRVLFLVNKTYVTKNSDLCDSEPGYLTPLRVDSYVCYLG